MRTAIEDIIKERACIEHEEGKLQILTNLIKDSILTIQGADKRMNMTEEVFRSKMRWVQGRWAYPLFFFGGAAFDELCQ